MSSAQLRMQLAEHPPAGLPLRLPIPMNCRWQLHSKAWTEEKIQRRWLPAAEIEITTATPGKSLRAKWGGGKSRRSVNFYAKGPRKTQVDADHLKLASSKEAAKMKAYGFEALNRLQKAIEA